MPTLYQLWGRRNVTEVKEVINTHGAYMLTRDKIMLLKRILIFLSRECINIKGKILITSLYPFGEVKVEESGETVF